MSQCPYFLYLSQSVHNNLFIECYLVPDQQEVVKYILEFATLFFFFFLIRMLFFWPRLNILIFLPNFRLKYSCIILKLVYVFCGEYCTYVLRVPFIELSLALNVLLYIASAGFFVLSAGFAVQRKE